MQLSFLARVLSTVQQHTRFSTVLLKIRAQSENNDQDLNSQAEFIHCFFLNTKSFGPVNAYPDLNILLMLVNIDFIASFLLIMVCRFCEVLNV